MIDECGMYFCTMMSEDHICDHTMELLLYFGISLLCRVVFNEERGKGDLMSIFVVV